MSDAGKQELLKELRARGLTELAERAEKGEFSDFGSPHAMPVTMLVQALKRAGHDGLALRAQRGDFDHDH
jgi:hypothetical protein